MGRRPTSTSKGRRIHSGEKGSAGASPSRPMFSLVKMQINMFTGVGRASSAFPGRSLRTRVFEVAIDEKCPNSSDLPSSLRVGLPSSLRVGLPSSLRVG